MTDFAVLRPFDRREALTLAKASEISGRSVATIRRWCLDQHIGRLVGGRWAVSRIALAMHLDGNGDALRAYLAGDRSGSAVGPYVRPTIEGAADGSR